MLARLPVMDLRLPSWLFVMISLSLSFSAPEVASFPVWTMFSVVLEYLITIGLSPCMLSTKKFKSASAADPIRCHSTLLTLLYSTFTFVETSLNGPRRDISVTS